MKAQKAEQRAKPSALSRIVVMVCFRFVCGCIYRRKVIRQVVSYMNQLNVPWDKIKDAVESGMPMRQVGELFAIKLPTIKARSLREKWSTPKRRSDALKKELSEKGNRVAGVQDRMVAINNSLEEQIRDAEDGQISTATSKAVDFDQATKDYRSKGVLKMAKLLDQTIIAPPRTWKDYDIADKMMRRLLGIDDNEGKSNTIVSLQLVNDRLAAGRQDDIVEGDFIEESVREPSFSDSLQSNLTGAESAPPSGGVPEEGQGLSGLDYSADSPALRTAE